MIDQVEPRPEPAGPTGAGSTAGSLPPAADRHFATAHLLTGLKGRTISSGIVTLLAQGVLFGLNLASIIVLARLLAPQDFGLVAMVATVMGFMRIFNDAGLSTATVQRENITHAQVSNLFWANVALGGLASVILALSAPAVAWFYREPRLVGITLVLCVGFLAAGGSVQHLALLKRQMQFKSIAIIQISAAVVGALVGIGMAWFGNGYWSLVGMQLAGPAVVLILAWSLARWQPQWPQRSSGTRSLLNFGANLSASSFLWSLAKGSDALLIGRFFGAASLGYYTRAQALLLRPLDQFTAPMEAVFVPTLSRLQGQPERYRRVVFQLLEVVAVAGFLFSGLLLALAHPLTLLVLGPKWAPAAPIFAGFSLVALYTPIVCVAGLLMTSQGRGRDFLLMSSICSLATVTAFLTGLPFGPVGVAIAYSACCLLIQLPAAFHFAGRSGPVNTRHLWGRFLTHLPVWGVVCGVTWLTHSLLLEADPLMQLLICFPAGLTAGAAFVGLYPPSRRVAISLIDALRHWRPVVER